jgi:hypothetical protein
VEESFSPFTDAARAASTSVAPGARASKLSKPGIVSLLMTNRSGEGKCAMSASASVRVKVLTCSIRRPLHSPVTADTTVITSPAAKGRDR